MKVFTYYMLIPGLWSDESQKALLEMWKASWSKHGWEPVVLTEEDAKKHVRYAEYRKRFWEFPTPFGHDYEGGCFLRWAAVAAAGGGFMSDYDVMNYGFPPTAPKNERMDVICDRSGSLWCGAINAPYYLYDRMCRIFVDWKHTEGDWLESGICHCEDQIFLQHFLDRKTKPCPPWLKWVDGCTLYPNLAGPLVHYTSAAMKADGNWPKHEAIPKLRAI